MKVRISKSIYFYLALIFIITTLLQISRLNSVVRWSANSNDFYTPSNYGLINALTEEEVALIDHENILLLFEPDDESSQKVTQNIEHVLQYMKKKYVATEVDQFNSQTEGYNLIIFAFADLDLLPDSHWIEPYVENGGSIFFATTLDSYGDTFMRLYRKLGIYEFGSYSDNTGIRFKSNVLLGYKNREFTDSSIQSVSLSVFLDHKTTVHATTNDIPLLWEVPNGQGKFMVFNSTMFETKSARGLISGAISLLMPDFIYPIMNMKLVYIDDFPAPFPLGFKPKIYDHYKMSNDQFFKEIWWPDMLRLAKLYDLKYTSGLIETYNDQVTSPFSNSSGSDLSTLIIFGRELIKSRGEIGLHGYNHQSLVFSERISSLFGYKSWHNQDDMVESLESLKKFVESVYPRYKLQTYIPPSNVLEPEGREALKLALPDLTNISSLYLEDQTNSAYVQEYEVAPDGIVELPRLTSGFYYQEYDQWEMVNAISSLGVFSHFVHPDDVIDTERGGDLTWDELYKQFNDYLAFVHDNYGWLRSLTASEATFELKKYAIAELIFDHQPNRIVGYINRFTDGLYFILRTDKKITDEVFCDVKRIDDQVYLVYATKEKFEIGLSE